MQAACGPGTDRPDLPGKSTSQPPSKHFLTSAEAADPAVPRRYEYYGLIETLSAEGQAWWANCAS